jgi:hypothetical protein
MLYASPSSPLSSDAVLCTDELGEEHGLIDTALYNLLDMVLNSEKSVH